MCRQFFQDVGGWNSTVARDRGGDFKGFICIEWVTYEHICAVNWDLTEINDPRETGTVTHRGTPPQKKGVYEVVCKGMAQTSQKT